MNAMNDSDQQPQKMRDVSGKESEAGILPSHGIEVNVPSITENGRPPVIRHLSNPAYQSPLRHHRRTPSFHREVKTTLDARSEYTNSQDDGKAEHHINQYIIKDEIGRGSFGAVHLAVDQYGQQYAVKEFSKSRLRKRAQSNILRRPYDKRRPGHLAAGEGLNSPLHRRSASDIHRDEEKKNPLYLIKEEIAIMKKLNHPNLVSLIEVLDDPEEDSLYMVLEMCKKGVVMKVGLDDQADPYDAEKCRHWFRDMILGIEYLHAQGVVHRDIKPDNLLLTEDDVLKIVDFGVSEMFEKSSEMMTAKSAGSPAFLPPELCVVKHGDISGKAADVWSMGISLYCLRHGKIPFNRSGVLELYEAIKEDDVNVSPEYEPEFRDLMLRLLEKDPKKRITMDEIRAHPWVTNNGSDPLLSKEENTDNLVEPPTELEMIHAITSNFKNLMVVMRAVAKFKNLLANKRPEGMASIFGKGRIVQPPKDMHGSSHPEKLIKNLGEAGSQPRATRSLDIHDRQPVETALATEGVTRDIDTDETNLGFNTPKLDKVDSAVATGSIKESTQSESEQGHQGHDHRTFAESKHFSREDSPGNKGHAHDPMDTAPLYLGVGSGNKDSDGNSISSQDDVTSTEFEGIAESPTAAEFNIYDTAYREEVERIRTSQGHGATVYLTRRVDRRKEFKSDEKLIQGPKEVEIEGQPQEGWKAVLNAARKGTRSGDESKNPEQQPVSKEGKDEAEKPDVEKTTGESLMEIVDDVKIGAIEMGAQVKSKVELIADPERRKVDESSEQAPAKQQKQGGEGKERAALSSVMQRVQEINMREANK